VNDRPSPFLVVISDVKLVFARPPAALHFFATLGFFGVFGPSSLRSCSLTRLNSARTLGSTSGNRGSIDSIASMMAADTTSRVKHFASAGTTYHGAVSVEVWRIMSS